MIIFSNDYNETVHPKLLLAILNTCTGNNSGYGSDQWCNTARSLLRARMNSPESDIHFFSAGTVTNLTFICHALRPSEAVISPETGHIAVQEVGAIEATGHKVITVPTADGKLTPDLIQAVLDNHNTMHMVRPKMVYISNTTEIGTIYTRDELIKLSNFCRKRHLIFFLDGARLAMALGAQGNTITLEDLAKYTDAFYIGGTKVGALMGEALIINNSELQQHFAFTMKQRGAILSKSWTIGVQFKTFFEDNLYFELGAHSNQMAHQLVQILNEYNIELLAPQESNQIFFILPDILADRMRQTYNLSAYSPPPKPYHTTLRLCTSWSTTQQQVDDFEMFMRYKFVM